MKILMFTLVVLMFTAAAHGQEPMLSCKYDGGKLTRPCRHILRQAAKQLKKQPLAQIQMLGGDDSTGEYLTSLGVSFTRISELPGEHGSLRLRIFQSCICEAKQR